MPRFTSKLRALPPAVGVAGLAAIAAAAAALWNWQKAKQAERKNPPIGRFIEVDGMRLHYSDTGTGPCVVLLHGNTVTLQDFATSGVADGLAENFRVVSFDRPGFGYSDRPRNRLWTAQAQAALIHRVFQELDIQNPIVVGHSWRTLVALSLAVDFPKHVRGLVLISGYYFPSARLDVAMTAPVALPVVGDVMRYTVSPFAGRLLIGHTVKAMFAPAPVPVDFFHAMPREILLRPLQIQATSEDAAFMIPATAQLRAQYALIDMPVRIFAGADDKIVDPQSHSVRLHNVLPHSALYEMPDAGHMVHYKFPGLVCAAISDIAAGDGRTLVPDRSQTSTKGHLDADAVA